MNIYKAHSFFQSKLIQYAVTVVSVGIIVSLLVATERFLGAYPSQPAANATLIQQAYCLPKEQVGTGLTKILNADSVATNNSSHTRQATKVVWTGWFRATVSGLHTFEAPNSHKTVVKLQNQAVWDWRHADRVSIPLSAGQFYAVRIEMHTNQSIDTPMVAWRLPKGELTWIQKENLFPSMATVSDGQTSAHALEEGVDRHTAAMVNHS